MATTAKRVSTTAAQPTRRERAPQPDPPPAPPLAPPLLTTLRVNAAGPARRLRRQGRDYVVADMVMIVPGVLDGSGGPVLYPPDIVGLDVDAWNDMPVVVDHPTENGAPVSARQPATLDARKVGRVYSAAFGDRLTAEAWLDLEAVRRVNADLSAALEAGRPVELSTGLYVTSAAAPADSQHHGRPYTHVARRLVPDHLALLPGGVGACSLADGCGLLLGNAAPPELSDRHRKLGLVAKGEAEAGRNPPSWVVDEALWEKAKAAADKMDCDDYYACVTAIYEKMGGTRGSTNMSATATPPLTLASAPPGATSAPAPSPAAPAPVTNCTAPAPPPARSQTAEEWLAAAPSEIQVAVRNALAIQQRERAWGADQVLTNAAGLEDARGRARVVLLGLPPDDFAALAAAFPARTVSPPPLANWLGAAGAALPPPVTEPPLVVPVPDFSHRNRKAS